MMNSYFLAVVAALVTARVTRLITRDQIFAGPRRRVLQRLREDGLWAYGLVCDWCISMYVGALAALGGWLLGAWPGWAVAPLALALSHVAGWLASKEGE